MSLEENKEVVRRLYGGLNESDLDVFDELLDPDYVHRSSPEYQFDRDGLKAAIINIIWKAFPDLRVTLEEVIAEGDKVVVRWTQRGTHLGPFLETPATGKRVEYSGINIFTVRSGKIVEDTPYWDFEVITKQLHG
jgi:steroid delta-isomerase-like uncharacterized protein